MTATRGKEGATCPQAHPSLAHVRPTWVTWRLWEPPGSPCSQPGHGPLAQLGRGGSPEPREGQPAPNPHPRTPISTATSVGPNPAWPDSLAMAPKASANYSRQADSRAETESLSRPAGPWPRDTGRGPGRRGSHTAAQRSSPREAVPRDALRRKGVRHRATSSSPTLQCDRAHALRGPHSLKDP